MHLRLANLSHDYRHRCWVWTWGDPMIFRISWAAEFGADPCRSETMSHSLCGFNKGWSVVAISHAKSLATPCVAKLSRKYRFQPTTYHRSIFVTNEIPKNKSSDWETTDHPFSKPHSPWPAGVGGPWNQESLNLHKCKPYQEKLLRFLAHLNHFFTWFGWKNHMVNLNPFYNQKLISVNQRNFEKKKENMFQSTLWANSRKR